MKLVKKDQSETLIVSDDRKIHARIDWDTNVDMDLHGFVKTHSITTEQKKGGFLGFGAKLIQTPPQVYKHHEYFGDRGKRKKIPPYLYLDKDSAIGNTLGIHDENMFFLRPSVLDEVIIAVNNFGRSSTPFKDWNVVCTITVGAEKLVVNLEEQKGGSWCTVAKIKSIDRTKGIFTLTNINEVSSREPSLNQYSHI